MLPHREEGEHDSMAWCSSRSKLIFWAPFHPALSGIRVKRLISLLHFWVSILAVLFTDRK